MRRLTTGDFIQKAEAIHGDRYNYSKSDYKNAKTKLTIICEEHGEFDCSPTSHLHMKTGCPKCSGQNMDTDLFITKAKKKHHNKYTYEKSLYQNAKTKLIITCPAHGDFLQRPTDHLSGCGCPKCAGIGKSLDDFKIKANKIFDNFYDYNDVIFQNITDKIIIHCPTHGTFEQRANVHLLGQGCQQCGYDTQGDIKRKDVSVFLTEAKSIHGEKYDYTIIEYKNTDTKIEIICPDHGVFKQTPNAHLRGQGCPKCTHRISKGETEWLDSLGVLVRQKRVRLDGDQYYTEFDGYDATTNTAYLYHGDYWHGNPERFESSKMNPHAKKSFGELYEKTINKERQIKDNGYNLIVMWEADWTGWSSK